MSFMDYKYHGFTVRERLDGMLGKNAGPIEWCIRAAIIGFALVTMADPKAHIYISPLHWAGIVAFIYFYL